MRSGQLHASLHAFGLEAAATLAALTASGAEVGFEVHVERERPGRPALYCYRPLTGEFITGHWDLLLDCPTAPAALDALSELPGLAGYLSAHAATAADDGSDRLAEAALRCFTARIFDGADSDFTLLPERFEPAYRELHQNAVEGRTEIALLGLLRGVTTKSPEIALDEGVLLAPLERLGVMPPDPAWVGDTRPSLVVAIDPGDGPEAVEHALARMRDLQSALRLYAAGISLEPLAWIRANGSEWRALPLPGGGRGDGKVLLVADRAEELKGFCRLIARRRPTEGEIAWALVRFELGCEREDPFVGLSDHLLALRALLEPEGPRSGRLAGRIAALCASAADRAAMTARLVRAIALEQAVIAGAIPAAAERKLAGEVEERLRALLRDVICGHLRGDLRALADGMLHAPGDEPHAGAEGQDFRISRGVAGTPFGSELFRPAVEAAERYNDEPAGPPTTESPIVARRPTYHGH
jgi:hypothetical protein